MRASVASTTSTGESLPARIAAANSAGRLSPVEVVEDRKSTRLNSSHDQISYAVFCLKKKKNRQRCRKYTPDAHSTIKSMRRTAKRARRESHQDLPDRRSDDRSTPNTRDDPDTYRIA